MALQHKSSSEISIALHDAGVEVSDRQVRNILKTPEVTAISFDLAKDYIAALEGKVSQLERKCERLAESRTVTTTIANASASERLEWVRENIATAEDVVMDIVSGKIPASGATRGQLAWRMIEMLIEAGTGQEEQTTERGLSREFAQVFREEVLGIRPESS